MTSHELRQKYLDFFRARGHVIVPSASLIPENDPTTLFTSSGMQPLIPYLLGEKHPQGARLTDSQKCFRSQDMEEVGDNRHTTFFEMLGNWSLGDYFKEEQIPWMFEFATKELGLDPKRLYFTCFRGNAELDIPRDEEAAFLWRELLEKQGIDAGIVDFSERDGTQDGRIFYYDEEKNWWSRSGVPGKMPVGEPGGSDTEIFWDFGAERELHEQSQWKDRTCHVNCDCGRFMEIGNNVFMEYRKTEDGFEKLAQKNVDFGGGLERMMAAVNDNPDVFVIDLFDPIRKELERISGIQYGKNDPDTKAFRVILDHIRAATFLIADGAPPSNKEQGYFTRRLIRRAIRYSGYLNIEDIFCPDIAKAVIDIYGEAYNNLKDNEEIVLSQIQEEEVRFRQTLAQGLKIFEKKFPLTLKEHDPKEPIPEIIKEEHDMATISGKEAFDLYQTYGFPLELIEEEAKKRHLFFRDTQKREFELKFQEEKKKHQDISRVGAEKKFKGGLLDHSEMSVKYHTATHLLHAALRRVLGPQAEQRGSNITPERLRFDFAHATKMTLEEIKKTENLVNAAIARDYPVSWQELPIDEARRLGAIGLFEENYGDKVKVYTVGDPLGIPVADPAAPTFSREFCGGPHVESTGVLKKFRIIKEEASSAGVRRIKAVLE